MSAAIGRAFSPLDRLAFVQAEQDISCSADQMIKRNETDGVIARVGRETGAAQRPAFRILLHEKAMARRGATVFRIVSVVAH